MTENGKNLDDKNSSSKKSKDFLIFFAQYILSPIIVIIFGIIFTLKLQQTKQNFQKVELELKRIEASQKMIQELFSGIPERAFVAERLLTKILDKELGAEIKKIVENYYSESLDHLIANKDFEKVQQITDAAISIGSDAGKQIIKKYEKSSFHIIIASSKNKTKSIELADSCKSIGYSSEVYLTPSGYYAITIGKFPFPIVLQKLKEEIGKGIANKDAWISSGKEWVKKIYPLE